MADTYTDNYLDSYDATTPVSSTRGTSWRTDATVASTRQSTWAALKKEFFTRQTTWKVWVPVVPPSTRGTTWRTLNRATALRPTTWAVAVLVPLTPVSSTRGTTWKVWLQVTSTRTTVWVTEETGRVSSNRLTRWAVRQPVTASTRATFWNTLAIPTAATSAAAVRLKVYAPNGSSLGLLPLPSGGRVSYPLNDVGALDFSYAKVAAKSHLIGQPCEIAVETTPDGGRTWIEPPDSRFVYLVDAQDPLAKEVQFSATARSYVWRLTKAVVLPPTVPREDGKRAFLMTEGANPGLIMKTLMVEASTRGALAGITHASFSGTTDSSGAPWPLGMTIYYTPGINYLLVLTNLADQGYIDFQMVGRDLRIYAAGTTLSQDRTVGANPVTFLPGRDHTDAPFRRTWEGLADYAYLAGDKVVREQTNTSAATPWGRQEMFLSDSRLSDPVTMDVFMEAALAQANDSRTEHTRALDFTRAKSRPFWDYGVGDYVNSSNGTALDKLRIRQLTLEMQGPRLFGSVVLNDRFLEADLRARRRQEGITNGAVGGDGGGTGPITDPALDSVAPGRVDPPSWSSEAYLHASGVTEAQVTLSWAAVTMNENSTLMEDFDHYEVFQRKAGSAFNAVRHVRDTVDTIVDMSPYEPLSQWWFSVQCVDRAGNRGLRSVEVLATMGSDATPPQQPSAPVLSSRLGVVFIAWNGLPVTGTWPRDFEGVEVHVSTTSNFTPTDSTLYGYLYGEGVHVYAGGSYGVPIYAKLIAYDRTIPPNKSVPSGQGSATPSRLVGTDLDPDAITYEQISFKDPGNVAPDGSLETMSGRARVGALSASQWTFTGTDKFHGDWAATINAAAGSGTSRRLYFMSDADKQQIMATDQLFCRMAYKGTAGANGVLQLVVEWTLADGTLTTSTVPGTVKNGTWQQSALKLAAPANTQDFRVYVELTSAATAGTYHVDAVEVRRVVGTSIIQDAAIKTAQIDLLAVNNAQIMDLSVGKITSGIMVAEVTLSGKFATALTGDRVEMGPQGIKAVRAGVTTVDITPTGTAKFTGEITASTVTGGLIRTAILGSRIELNDAGGLKSIRSDASFNVSILNSSEDPTVLHDGMQIGTWAAIRLMGGTNGGYIYKDPETRAMVLRSTNTSALGGAISMYDYNSVGDDYEGYPFANSIQFYAGGDVQLKLLEDGTGKFQRGMRAEYMRMYADTGGSPSSSTSSTGFQLQSNSPSPVFIAPPSGVVKIEMIASMATSIESEIVLMDVQVRRGSTIGSGTIVYSPNGTVFSAGFYTQRHSGYLILANLEPYAEYHCRLFYRSSSGNTVTLGASGICVTPSL